MKIEKPGPHLDQMMRQTRAHHVQLSSMADAKANMLITVSSLMITIAVGFVKDERLQYAGVTLVAFCIVTVLMAAYVSMPKLRRTAPRDPSSPTFNPLFFGDFSSLPLERYEQVMEGVMADASTTHTAAVREVYVMGQYLAKQKYRYLGWAYVCFIGGLMVTAVVWLFTYVLK